MNSLINRFFRKKTSQKTASSDHDDKLYKFASMPPTPTEQVEKASAYTQTKLSLASQQLIVGLAQSAGIQRDHNEDTLFAFTNVLLSDSHQFQVGLFIIADGMGGHENGEIASRIAVGQLASHVTSTLYLPLLSASNNTMRSSIQEMMLVAVLQAHNSVRKEAFGGGTTLTAALILGDQLTITHVGDSRAYLLNPDGNLRQMTHDHSVVKRLEEIGQISSEQASIHPQRNVLYRALGQGEPLEPDIESFHLQHGCQVMLCSDGLWGVIPEDEISKIIRSSPSPQLACQTLVALANSAGGPDNISVIIVQIPE